MSSSSSILPSSSFNSKWIRVSCISDEIMKQIHCRKGMVCDHDDRHYIVMVEDKDAEFKLQSEEELFDYYVQKVSKALDLVSGEARKRIYVVSCGYCYGFCLELQSIAEKFKLGRSPNVSLVMRDCLWKKRDKYQPAKPFVPLNKNDRLHGIFSYYHLSQKTNPNWKNDHWLVHCGGIHYSSYQDLLSSLTHAVQSFTLNEAKKRIYVVWYNQNIPIGFGAVLHKNEVKFLTDKFKRYKVFPDFAFDDIKNIGPGGRGVMHIHSSLGNSGTLELDCSLSRSLEGKLAAPSLKIWRTMKEGLYRDLRLSDIYSFHYLAEPKLGEESKHWVICINPVCGFPTKHAVLVFCSSILQKSMGRDTKNVLAKIRIVWCKKPYGFCAEIDEMTANKMKKDRENVISVLPVSDFENNKYHREGIVIMVGAVDQTVDLKVKFDPVTEDGDPWSLDYASYT